MDSRDIEKICPFCDEVFSANEIKSHIAISHFDILQSEIAPEKHLENDQPVDHNEVTDVEMKSREEGTEKEPKTQKKCQSGGTRFRINCDFCGKSFTSKNSLKRHKIMASCHVSEKKGKRYQCAQCEKNFTTKNSLRFHNRSFHEGKRYQCAQCDQSYAFRGDYQTHVRVKHEGLSFRCELCDKKFTKKSSLKVHNIMVHKSNVSDASNQKVINGQDDKFSCTRCRNVFKNRSSLVKHYILTNCQRQPTVALKRLSKKIIESYRPKQTDEMTKVMALQPKIRLERLSTRTIKLWKQSNDKKIEYRQEVKENLGDNLNQFVCCGRIFKSQKVMAYHKKVVHESEQELCKSCGQMFESVEAFNNHVKLNHVTPVNKATKTRGLKPEPKVQKVHEKLRFSCAECLKTFTKKQWFNAHRCEKTNKK